MIRKSFVREICKIISIAFIASGCGFTSAGDSKSADSSELNNSYTDDVEFASVGASCIEGVCSYVTLSKSGATIYSDCCDYMLIDGKRELFEVTRNYDRRYFILTNSDWEIFMEFKELDTNVAIGDVNMKGEMVLTNRITKKSKVLEIEGAIILEGI
jgi:hypothetical protein